MKRKIKLNRKKIKFAALIILAISAGCSSGNQNRIISNIEGDLSETEYISPDSIPRSFRPEKYLLGYGDMIDVNLLHNEKYSRNNLKIRPDGIISYPYIGEIDVRGMTAEELEKILTDGFSRIIKRPEVSVIIKEFKPLNIYVLGEVDLPGVYDSKRAGTVLQALSNARGLTDAAKKNGVLVIRKTGPKKIAGIQVDLTKIFEENRYEYNISLEPNDIVMVPKNKIARVTGFVNSYLGIMEKPYEMLRTYYYIRQMQASYEHFIVRTE